MRLSDIMGNADLAIWPSIGLVLFLSIFVIVVFMTFSRKRSAQYKEASQIPLDDYIPVHEREDNNE